jgi:uncharacterized protein (DUF433 family)
MKIEMATTADKQSLANPEHYVFPHITKVPDVCGGYATIDGHRIRVIDIVYMHQAGYTPEKIVEQYASLDLVQIYAALTYYYENREALDKEMREYDAYFERMDKQWKEYVERHGGHPPDKPAPEDRHIAKPADWKPKR